MRALILLQLAAALFVLSCNHVPGDSYELYESDESSLKSRVDQENQKSKALLSGLKVESYLPVDKPIAPKFVGAKNFELTKDGFFFVKSSDDGKSDEVNFHSTSKNSFENVLSFPIEDGKYTIGSFKVSSKERYIVLAVTRNGSERTTLWVYDRSTRILRSTGLTESQIPLIQILPDESGFVYNKHDQIDSKDQAQRLLGSTLRFVSFQGFLESKNLINESIKPFPSDLFHVRFAAQSNRVFLFAFSGTIAPYRIFTKPMKDFLDPAKSWKQLATEDERINIFAVTDSSAYAASKGKDGLFKIIQLEAGEDRAASRRELGFGVGQEVKDFYATKEHLYAVVSEKMDTSVIRISKGLLKEKEVHRGSSDYVNQVYASPLHETLLVRIASFRSPSYLAWHSPANTQTLIPLNQSEIRNEDLEEILDYADNGGTAIPYTIIKAKDTPFSKDTKAIVYAFGSYGMSSRPTYSQANNAWYKKGGIYVYCHVRGGGELGTQWHEAGRKKNKINSFLDAVACIDDLVKKERTSFRRTAFLTGSAGGLIAGAIIAHHPEKVRAVVAQNAVLNVRKIFQASTGKANEQEYGSPDNPEEKAVIDKLDPFDKISASRHYPYVFLQHGYNDSRVPVWMSVKMAKYLEDHGAEHVYLQSSYSEGHGLGRADKDAYREIAERLAFIEWALE